jgi:hypothetical protein
MGRFFNFATTEAAGCRSGCPTELPSCTLPDSSKYETGTYPATLRLSISVCRDLQFKRR